MPNKLKHPNFAWLHLHQNHSSRITAHEKASDAISDAPNNKMSDLQRHNLLLSPAYKADVAHQGGGTHSLNIPNNQVTGLQSATMVSMRVSVAVVRCSLLVPMLLLLGYLCLYSCVPTRIRASHRQLSLSSSSVYTKSGRRQELLGNFTFLHKRIK